VQKEPPIRTMRDTSRPKSLVDALRAVYGPGYRPYHPIVNRNEHNAFQIKSNTPRTNSTNTPIETFESEDDPFADDVDDEQTNDEVDDDDDDNAAEINEQSPTFEFCSARKELKTNL